MFGKIKIVTFLVGFFVVAYAQEPSGYEPVPYDDYPGLTEKLENSNIAGALGVPMVTVEKMVDAYQQVGYGTYYEIVADVLIKGQQSTSKCCFSIYASPKPSFEVHCAHCGPTCGCF